MTSLPSHVSIADRAVSRDLNGQRVLLNLDSGLYFGLDELGGRIWQLLDSRTQPEEICAVLTREYDVDRKQCEADVVSLLHSLVEHGLIVVRW